MSHQSLCFKYFLNILNHFRSILTAFFVLFFRFHWRPQTATTASSSLLANAESDDVWLVELETPLDKKNRDKRSDRNSRRLRIRPKSCSKAEQGFLILDTHWEKWVKKTRLFWGQQIQVNWNSVNLTLDHFWSIFAETGTVASASNGQPNTSYSEAVPPGGTVVASVDEVPPPAYTTVTGGTPVVTCRVCQVRPVKSTE